jgi:NhaP-type Na+/H+ or K+/H+ antiporter
MNKMITPLIYFTARFCNDKLGESGFTATFAAMMFSHYSTSPEFNKFISNTRFYIYERGKERDEHKTEQKRENR